MAIKRKDWLQEAQRIAESHGGQCLSERCPTTKSTLIMLCKAGHEWDAKFYNIKYHDRWCKKCVSISQSNTIQDAQNIAIENGGNCLSKEYINSHSKLLWKCKNSHIFKSSYNKISQGRWCATCSKRKKHTIELAQEIAKSRGGKCLSERYISLKKHLMWECEKGHVWKSTLNNVKNHNKWCGECNIRKSQSILSSIISSIYKSEVYNNFRTFSWLGGQEIDIFVPSIKLAIEYDGEQHFMPVRFNGISKEKAEQNFVRNQELDKIKNAKIYKNSEDIRYFIRFNYKDKLEQKYIINKLKWHNIPVGETNGSDIA